MADTQYSPDALRALLSWYREMGIDEVTGTTPSDFTTWGAPPKLPGSLIGGAKAFNPAAASPAVRAQQKAPAPAARAPAKISGMDAPMPADEAIAEATALASAAQTIDDLRTAIMNFDGCPLKPGARNTVIDDGIFGAPLMVLGEAPGKDEDRVGKPFIGRAGQLLDKMLAAIGHSRFEDELAPTWISNSIFWRPPGNRTPTKIEIAICLPFVQRLIELANPKVIILVGNTPTQTLFEGTPGITRARGVWKEHVTATGVTIPACPMFHPAFLLRQPAQKRLTWDDLRAVRKKLVNRE